MGVSARGTLRRHYNGSSEVREILLDDNGAERVLPTGWAETPLNDLGFHKEEARQSGKKSLQVLTYMPKNSPSREKEEKTQQGRVSPYIIALVAIGALVIGMALGYLVMGIATPGKAKGAQAIIILDDKCTTCNQEMNSLLEYLDDQMKLSSIPTKYLKASDPEARKILQVLAEENANFVPVVVFTGDIENTTFYKEFDRLTKPYGGAARFIRKIGEYYVLQPAWTARMVVPPEEAVKIVAYVDENVGASLAERVVYRLIPTADLQVIQGHYNYMFRFEGPQDAIERIAAVFPLAERDGNVLIVPYIHAKVYVLPSFAPGVKEILAKLPNVLVTEWEIIDTNAPYLAKIETDRPELLAQILRNWERDGNVLYVPKTDKPVVELFVMSYCPYGLQTEKAIIPVLELLGDKIDFKLRFVNYAMHGEKEVWENLRQYCIQFKTNPDKFIDYLKCFTESGNAEKCMEELNIDKNAVQSCMDEEDKRWGISQILANPGAWGGPYPPFPHRRHPEPEVRRARIADACH